MQMLQIVANSCRYFAIDILQLVIPIRNTSNIFQQNLVITLPVHWGLMYKILFPDLFRFDISVL